MKTVMCPLCNAALHIAFKMEKVDGWKKCNHCNQPVYVSVDSDGNSSTVSLRDLIDEVIKGKPGVEMLQYLLKQDENAMQDILFTAGKIVEKDVKFLEEVKVLDKTIRGYSIKPGLRPYVEEQLAPHMEKPDLFKDFV